MNITKQVLLLIIGILAVILFVQVGRITGYLGVPSQIINATVTTENVAPTVDITAFSISQSACANGTITLTAMAHDANGGADIKNASAVIYSPLTNDQCAANPTNCYINASCALGTTNGNDRPITCTMSNVFRFYADNGTWTAKVTVFDNSDASASNTSTYGVSQIIALDVKTDPLNFGTVSAGSSSSEVQEKVSNCGNWKIDLQLNGTDLTCSSGCGQVNTIGVGNVSYSNQSGAGYVSLTTTPTLLQFNLDRQTSDTVINGTTYWKIFAPYGTKGTYTGTIRFTAVADQ